MHTSSQAKLGLTNRTCTLSKFILLVPDLDFFPDFLERQRVGSGFLSRGRLWFIDHVQYMLFRRGVRLNVHLIYRNIFCQQFLTVLIDEFAEAFHVRLNFLRNAIASSGILQLSN